MSTNTSTLRWAAPYKPSQVHFKPISGPISVGVVSYRDVRRLDLVCTVRASNRERFTGIGVGTRLQATEGLNRYAYLTESPSHGGPHPKGLSPKNSFRVDQGDQAGGWMGWLLIPRSEVPAYLAALRLLLEGGHG